MDAKVGDWIVAPRIGKPIEVNALWYNALRTVEGLGPVVPIDTRACGSLAHHARAGLARFFE